ncbi:MAG: lytic transglycosylase domain-containing protein, partial [Bacteroidota bacterium]
MKKYLLCLSSWLWFDGYGQLPTPEVPTQLSFADIELTIQKAARQEIQQSVDALHRSHTYFQKLLEKTDLHFAVIAPILAAEKIPDDFKYLAIQESSFVGNAVSSSNAVGYWQFKAASATELGLRVDKEIDERMNLYAATKAACAYWKRSNVYFDNWAYTLISYNTGFTGAKSIAKEKYFGKKKMT